MIAYDLKCSRGHVFEGWFDDNGAFCEQQAKGLIACPICNDAGVSRLPSRFAIRGQPSEASQQSLALAALGQKIAEYVDQNFDNVGPEFAKEALKIHYGINEPRNIRGSSTPEEEKTLRDEGVEFLKVPVPLPQDTDA